MRLLLGNGGDGKSCQPPKGTTCCSRGTAAGSASDGRAWGNPGTFAVGAPAPWTAAIHAPRCEQFGGFRESWTCRFRYQQYENLIEDMSHIRAFTEINGALDNGTEYHLRGPVGRG